MRKCRYSFFLSGGVYALGPIEARSLLEARQWIKNWLGVKRLPRRTQIWKVN